MGMRSSDATSWEDEIWRCIETHPQPSAIGWELYNLLSTDEASLNKAMDLIRTDPAFAARVIGFANTAQFGHHDVASIREAVSVVGISELMRFSLIQAFCGLAPERMVTYDQSADAFRLKSMACAAAMDYLYEEERACGDMHTIGLLHSIGEVFIDAAVSWQQGEPIRFHGSTFRKLARVEEGLLGLNHAKVAGMALRAWQFPDRVVIPIEQQFELQAGAKYYDVTKSLIMARFVAAAVVKEQLHGVSPKGDVSQIVYRDKVLSEVFEYAIQQRAKYELAMSA